jgi:hypothetical protein
MSRTDYQMISQGALAIGAPQWAQTGDGGFGVKGGPKTRLDKTETLLPLDPQLLTSAWRSGQLSALCHEPP